MATLNPRRPVDMRYADIDIGKEWPPELGVGDGKSYVIIGLGPGFNIITCKHGSSDCEYNCVEGHTNEKQPKGDKGPSCIKIRKVCAACTALRRPFDSGDEQ